MTDALLYARVSTTDKDQDPDTQLFPLREYCGANDWHIAGEYVDRASARDLAHRKDWRNLLDHCSRRRGKFVVVVFKLDRAFRSVKDMHDTLATWELQDIEFRSIREQFDTSTAVGRLLLNMLAAVAEFELEMIRERVKAGMDRARRQGNETPGHQVAMRSSPGVRSSSFPLIILVSPRRAFQMMMMIQIWNNSPNQKRIVS